MEEEEDGKEEPQVELVLAGRLPICSLPIPATELISSFAMETQGNEEDKPSFVMPNDVLLPSGDVKEEGEVEVSQLQVPMTSTRNEVANVILTVA